MNSFKDALDDYEDRSDAELGDSGAEGAGEDADSALYTKDKKCRALVWMKMHEYPLMMQPAIMASGSMSGFGGSRQLSFGGGGASGTNSNVGSSLQVREIWFVLLEEEAATATATASIMDSKNTDNTALAGVLEKEELKFTY